jgi:hypothetical protein
MRTLVSSSVIALSAGLALCCLALGQEPNEPEPNAPAYRPPQTAGTNLLTPSPEKLFSPSVSRLFYEMAYEIIHREDTTDSQAEQAVVLLNAAMNLDVSTGFATADMLTIASRPGPARHLQMLYNSLIKYVDKNADCQVATNAARYLLEQLDSRQQREILLNRLIRDIGESNPSVKSELATELGLLYAEKADDPNATRALALAYTWNRYNQLAFEKLAELAPEQISPVLYLEYLRLKLRENPLDIDTALSFAQYAQKVQLYDVAADSYQYCADLFRFLYPGLDVPIAIYIDWMTSCYNALRSQPKCLQLAEQLRKQGRFDLQIEVLAARAAAKTGDTNMAEQILKTAEQKALHLAGLADQNANYKPLAWFYCFVQPNAGQAADWANKAYSAEPNSPLAAGLLACVLADNNQPDSAKSLIDHYPQTQLATMAQAKLYLAAGQKQSALDSLRAAIDKDPGSIVAEQAQRLLTEQQAEYIPIFDTGLILTNLKQTVGEQIVPQFVSPDQMLSFQLNLRGNRFSYGNNFDGVISITNNWYEPLVISEKSLCRGRITIDANVTGDLNRRIEKLISTTTRPSLPVEPGHSTLVPVRLCTGPLKELLLSHPQASLNIQFTAYLDPVVTSEGNIVSAIPGIKPATVQIERPRVEITTEFLQNRFNSLSKGKQSPKIKAAQLFAGLLLESQDLKSEIRNPKSAISYKLTNADWMAPMLKSALAHGLTDSDWVVKVHSMAAIADLPLDYELTNAAAQGLNDQHWPARMMAVWLLAQKQGDNFAKVLDHTAQYDSSEFVRNMAIALGAKVPEPNQTLEQPFLDLLRQEPNSDSNSL